MIQEIVKNKMKEVMLGKGYPFFENGDFNLNIIGVRSAVQEANSFDDWMFVLYKNRGIWQVKCFDCTTDAGAYWLENPMNVNGTAVLVPDCYRSSYKIRKHRGKYDALCQYKNVKVYRDNNLDQIIDKDESTITEGIYGINLHKSHNNGLLTDGKSVDRFSAGCQVLKSEWEFKILMNLAKVSRTQWGNSFTYTLLTYKDFE